MDRHQHVEKLIKERDELKKEVSNLKLLIKKAEARTKEAILSFGSRDGCASGVYAFNVNSSFELNLPENEQVSDEAIKKLYKEIVNLEDERGRLDIQLQDLQRQDFVKYLQGLINEG